MEQRFTARQGQYLAFIYHYTQVHRQPPSEADLEQYFRVAWSTIHQMIVRLEKLGLITRQPGMARSIRVLVPEDTIPRMR